MAVKAYDVTDRNRDEDVSYIIFAESRGKAIMIALYGAEGAFDNYRFTELRAHRCPALDKFYRGYPVMDWMDDEDRIAMVRYAGYECSCEVNITFDKCIACPAHEWCGRFERMDEDRKYWAAVEMQQHCENYEPIYNIEDGSM